MTALRVWLARLLGTLTGRRREDDLHDELETHLAMLAEEHERRGLDPSAARLAARRDLGGVSQTRETFRDTRVLPGLDALRQAGFSVQAEGSRAKVSKLGCAAVIEDRGEDAPAVGKAGVVVGDDIGLFVDGGFQKFFLTRGGRRIPRFSDCVCGACAPRISDGREREP